MLVALKHKTLPSSVDLVVLHSDQSHNILLADLLHSENNVTLELIELSDEGEPLFLGLSDGLELFEEGVAIRVLFSLSLSSHLFRLYLDFLQFPFQYSTYFFS